MKFINLNLKILIICITIFYNIPVNAQDTPVTNYLQQIKDNAEIYNGKIEAVYNILQYENFPYYINADFTDASIVYRKSYYPNQKVRLDLFQEQLIVLAPEKQHGIILNSQNVEKVFMYNKMIVWLMPPKESGIKPGYFIQLSEGKKLQLFCKEKYLPRQIILNKTFVYIFDHNKRYYLSYNNKYYPVKNKGSFSKLFPKYKKQINKFVKDNKLNFDQNKDKSLVSLAGYCEELLISNE